MPRFFCPASLRPGLVMELPPGAARHVQVLRLQPGDAITLFNFGPGWDGPASAGEFDAQILRMGRNSVEVEVGVHHTLERELGREVHLAIGMPANERMDWLVEKATELGVASIQPLMTQRSVVRLSGERADKKQAHWQSVAIAACEQCGGNRVPPVWPVQTLEQWLGTTATRHEPVLQRAMPASASAEKFLLSLANGTVPLRDRMHLPGPVVFLCGPEGGLSPQEEAMARAAAFAPVSLGVRVLRSETAALAALTLLG